MKPQSKAVTKQDPDSRARVFAGVYGLFLGLVLLKFGNPPIMEKYVTAPDGFFEFLLGYPWPISWAYWLLAIVAVIGVVQLVRGSSDVPVESKKALKPGSSDVFNGARPSSGAAMIRSKQASGKALPPAHSADAVPEDGNAAPKRCSPVSRWLIGLPLIWFLWQILAGAQTLDGQLTIPTLKHFAAITVCFYIGYFCLGRLQTLGRMWVFLFFAFGVVLFTGFEQHFGGLEATQRYFYLYIYPTVKDIPPEYLKKMSSTRIFGTQFYPNALAGMCLLIAPGLAGAIWRCDRLTVPARSFVLANVGAATLACLYWSKSKGGWLLALLLCVVVLLRLSLPRFVKIALVVFVIMGGLAGFFWKYAAFFEKGATSVSARFDYWRAAIQTTADHPIFGTGPGTFAIPYANIKRPESEMSRMVHNDYLEQASDSGIPGFVAFGLLVGWGLIRTYPRFTTVRSFRDGANGGNNKSWEQVEFSGATDWNRFLMWLGVLGYGLQSFLEFGLYLPALAWPAFTFLGWLLARS